MPKIVDVSIKEALVKMSDGSYSDDFFEFNDDFFEFNLECRMDDGQKFSPIVINGEYPELAELIAAFLIKEQVDLK